MLKIISAAFIAAMLIVSPARADECKLKIASVFEHLGQPDNAFTGEKLRAYIATLPPIPDTFPAFDTIMVFNAPDDSDELNIAVSGDCAVAAIVIHRKGA